MSSNITAGAPIQLDYSNAVNHAFKPVGPIESVWHKIVDLIVFCVNKVFDLIGISFQFKSSETWQQRVMDKFRAHISDDDCNTVEGLLTSDGVGRTVRINLGSMFEKICSYEDVEVQRKKDIPRELMCTTFSRDCPEGSDKTYGEKDVAVVNGIMSSGCIPMEGFRKFMDLTTQVEAKVIGNLLIQTHFNLLPDLFLLKILTGGQHLPQVKSRRNGIRVKEDKICVRRDLDMELCATTKDGWIDNGLPGINYRTSLIFDVNKDTGAGNTILEISRV